MSAPMSTSDRPRKSLLDAVTSRLRVPKIVTLQVTDRCNYDCAHCYQQHDAAPDELSLAEIERILGELAEAGVLFLLLMGGEFFMRRDADDILARAHALGFAIRLKTTGHHVTDQRADFLATLKPIQVDLSLYSASRHVHEQVTRQPGSWERTVAAARRLSARGVPVVLRSPVMKVNADALAGVTQLATEIGCERSFDPRIIARQGGDDAPTALRMDADELRRFYAAQGEELGTAFRGYDPATRSAGGRELSPARDTPCGAGITSVSIAPDGKVWPCNTLNLVVGDLRRQSFREVWGSRGGSGTAALEEVRAMSWASLDECAACELRPFCQRCHAAALDEHGALRGPSLEACRHAVVTRDELRARGVIPPGHTVMPPTWDRVDPDGQHQALAARRDGRRRSAALRVLP
jgi:radical SAM protein with 4Fe4S-binding SPASM domain